MENISKSDKFQLEYCASIVKIGEVMPVPDSDHLGVTFIDAMPIVVDRNLTHEGDIMVYCMNETMINKDFCAENNLFDVSNRMLNKNSREIEDLYNRGDEASLAEAKKMCGFFNKYGRVKMIKLRGQYSMGFLTSLETVKNWKTEFDIEEAKNHVGENFDCICGELFIKVYMPDVKEHRKGTGNWHNGMKPRFKKYIDGTVTFHYHTEPLNKTINEINPEDELIVTPKIHGTSAIYGNVLTKVKLPKTITSKICQIRLKKHHYKNETEKDFLKKKAVRTGTKYDYIACSRKIVLNAYEDATVKGEWGWILDNVIRGKLAPGMKVYGEISGFKPNSTSYIQKNYDYKSKTGKCRFWPYRINDDKRGEWTMQEVIEWAISLKNSLPKEFRDYVGVLPILYEGTAKDMYDIEIAPGENALLEWREKFLENIGKDSDRLGIEAREPLNDKKEPREGVCIRIGDKLRTYKYKSLAFLSKEGKMIDAGEVDYEMEEGYSEEP